MNKISLVFFFFLINHFLSKCWRIRSRHTAVGPATRGVCDSKHRCHHHGTGTVQTEDAHVQRKHHSKPCNPYIPQHTSLHPCQQWASSSCNCQPARDPHPASQHTSDSHPGTSPYTITAPAQKESVTYGTVSYMYHIYLFSFVSWGLGWSSQPVKFSLFLLFRGTRCMRPKKCSRQPTRSQDQRRHSSWASWLDRGVRICCLFLPRRKLAYVTCHWVTHVSPHCDQ